MNIYTVHFSARCPLNGKGIKYTLEVYTGAVLMAEDLRGHVDAIGEGLHEDIADALLAKFGGSQRLEAEHHGVHIRTIRPHLAHWQKPASPAAPNQPTLGHPGTQDRGFSSDESERW